MLRFITSFLLVLGFSFGAFAQYDISFKLNNYDNDTLIVGYYFGSQTLAKDTLISKTQNFRMKADTSLPAGVYMALKQPDNAFIQFFVPENDQTFKVEWDVNTNNPTFTGSKDNSAFEDYVAFLTKKRSELQATQRQIKENAEIGKDTTSLVQRVRMLDGEVTTYQKNVVKGNPGTVTALFLKSSLEPEIPNFTTGDVREKRYQYYKNHYFDNIDLGNPTILRTPFIQEKIMYYMDKLVSYEPDSVKKEVDFILSSMESAPRTRRFYLGEFLDKYANSRIIGMDAVFVHLADKYYSPTKTPWVKEESMKEIKRLANNMKSTLIGSQFPSITTFKADGNPVKINDIKSEYKIVVFWSHKCSHCQKSMPDLIKFNEKFKNQGVKVVTICTKGRKKAAECMKYVKDRNDMEDMLNTYDAKRDWSNQVYVPLTPAVFLLDANNKILLKDLPVSKLSDLLPKVKAMYGK